MPSAVERIRLWLTSAEPAGATATVAAEGDRVQTAAPLALCAIALGHALHLANGTFHPNAIAVLAALIAVVAAALVAPHFSVLERWGTPAALVIAGAGLVYQLGVHLTAQPGIDLRTTSDDYVHHQYLVALAAVVVGLGLAGRGAVTRFATPALLAAHLLLGAWMIQVSPNPPIDVFVWHREAFSALGAGQNPYSVSMPNIYGHTMFYGSGVADAVRVHVGFPYPPLSLLAVAPAHLLAGDYRYGNLLALTAAGALMAYARPGRLGFAAAALFLFTPRHLFVIEQGWTDPLAAFFLSMVVFVGCRHPRALPYAFGLLLAVKQYTVLLFPLGFLLAGKPWEPRRLARLGAISLGIAAALVVPFALLAPEGFFRSVVLFQSRQPFRADSLSFMAFTAREGVAVLPLWLSFALVPVGWAWALWRAPRTPSGFAASTALVLLLFFGFAKQAFCNYYFVILSALCCALAALPSASEPRARRRPPG